MKNLWIISVLFVALFWNANTMPVKQDSSENGQQLVPSQRHKISPCHRVQAEKSDI